MACMTIREQLLSHTEFLLECGLQVEEIQVGQGFLRCPAASGSKGRGELCYSTKASLLRNGMMGLATWARGENGMISVHKTYGHSDPFFFGLSYFRSEENSLASYERDRTEAVNRAKSFWDLSDSCGSSDYLGRKGVGFYGIRFRNNSYGKVAVIPLKDEEGTIWNCQLLNTNGSKRFLRGARTRGLFHKLHKLRDGQPVGLCESYVTAATCQELTKIPMVTAFSCHNLVAVSLILQQRFPQSPLVIFADNDRHLAENKGVKAARAVNATGKERIAIMLPEFGTLPADSEHTDWNDLHREIGREATKKMMLEMLKHRGIL